MLKILKEDNQMKSILKTATGTALGVLGASIISTALVAVCIKPITNWYFKQSVAIAKDIDALLEDED